MQKAEHGKKDYPIPDIFSAVINPDDLKVEFFRSSGPGGQHMQKNATAVRITHKPTGIVVSCQNERSQIKNRDMAMKVLRSRIYEFELEKRREEARKLEEAKPEISFGSQIRSYVMQPYQLVKDHRTKLEIGDVQSVLDGKIDPFIHAWLVSRRTPAGATVSEEEKDE